MKDSYCAQTEFFIFYKYKKKERAKSTNNPMLTSMQINTNMIINNKTEKRVRGVETSYPFVEQVLGLHISHIVMEHIMCRIGNSNTYPLNDLTIFMNK